MPPKAKDAPEKPAVPVDAPEKPAVPVPATFDEGVINRGALPKIDRGNPTPAAMARAKAALDKSGTADESVLIDKGEVAQGPTHEKMQAALDAAVKAEFDSRLISGMPLDETILSAARRRVAAQV